MGWFEQSQRALGTGAAPVVRAPALGHRGQRTVAQGERVSSIRCLRCGVPWLLKQRTWPALSQDLAAEPGRHFKSCATVNLHKLNFQAQDSFLVGTKFVGQTLTNNILREFHDVMCCYLALNMFPQPSLLVWLVLLITVLYDQTCLLLLLVSCVLLWSHTCFHFCAMSPRVLSSPCSETQWCRGLCPQRPQSPVEQMFWTSLVEPGAYWLRVHSGNDPLWCSH